MDEIVIRGARVVDGSGAPAYAADVSIESGRVSAVDRPGVPRGRRTVEADGLVLAPGFVDMHAHSDLALLTDPWHTAKVAQGVTTEVIGQDGLSYAPVDDRTLPDLRKQLTGWNGDPPDLDWNWRTVAEYLDRLDDGIATNAAYLVPHGTLRMLCVGPENRPASDSELGRMRRELARALSEGAFGMSSGLTYAPGMYATTSELASLCEVVAEHGGYHCPHHRSYGAGALAGYEEMIGISRESDCALHLAHATVNFEVNRGRAPELLRMLDEALDSGVDVTLDSYPYLAGCTSLHALLPSWVFGGGVETTLLRLSDPSTRERILRELEVEGSDGAHGVPIDWSVIEVNGVRHPDRTGHLLGRSIAEAAESVGVAAGELYLDTLLSDELGSSCLMHVGHEENVRAIMGHRVHTVGTDGLLTGERPHPRGWGTFPRYLARYVRELGLLDLSECVRHMTSAPARRLGLRDRGLVRPGMVADLVLFDPDEVRDNATFEQPRALPSGIEHVLVNGVPVLEHGVRNDATPGRALRRGASAPH
ncbi:N-acyl-D-amino-acid deacylase [Actinopolyspora xinjiangensis]|uniref:N-acyl-D-amino-acid deacylase n=1 Tax=Actinopolyspora xinjiangensis TaxID=405564 RepID=A0A1H0WP95_9ACTN|nr:D-aminoacylase [Actinopolyspora xinjiangensis]SDP92483.1 N-acyl-D-amino-acid deacylase [Actinopolyspora xinjiangensis]